MEKVYLNQHETENRLVIRCIKERIFYFHFVNNMEIMYFKDSHFKEVTYP